MLNAQIVFESNIREARQLSILYEYLEGRMSGLMSFDDILRFQIVYAVSAFDKLIHDLIRVGMVATFCGARQATPKYDAETISIKFHSELKSTTLPPAEILFERELYRKFSALSFQDPDKVADGLAYIWPEKQKWEKIAKSMGMTADNAKKQLKLITGRRNAIVHEADIDPVFGTKRSIYFREAVDIVDFIELCGVKIVESVI